MLVLWSVVGWAAPDAAADCDSLERYYQKQRRDRPADRPELWWLEEDGCPVGATLAGTPPPAGNAVWCEDKRLRRQGPRTEFVAGRIVLATQFLDDEEVGRRIEWDATGTVIRTTELKDGDVHGEKVEWTPDGGVTISQFVRGDPIGATWRFDEAGHLLVVEHWSGGDRNGRSCTWRDGQMDTDQLWNAGSPVAAAE